MSAVDSRPLIAHVVYRFDIGGLENGVVNLLNRLPRERWRHAVVALTEATSFRARVQRDDVRFVELHKGPGHGIGLLPRLTRILRELAPDVVHTRNLACTASTAATSAISTGPRASIVSFAAPTDPSSATTSACRAISSAISSTRSAWHPRA